MVNNWGASYSPPHPFDFPTNSMQTVQGDQSIISSEKYYVWIRNQTNETDAINHHSFLIRSNDNIFTSRFRPTYSGVTIENTPEGFSSTIGGNIKFADPWYIDYADPDYADGVRNRGMKDTGPDALQYRERTSPFYPDYSTVYQNGDDPAHAYQGVFLNQYVAPDKPYYAVQAVSPQDIYLGGSLGTRKFWFRQWSATNASIQGGIGAGVVFTSADATVSAILKGHRLSNDQNGIRRQPA